MCHHSQFTRIYFSQNFLFSYSAIRAHIRIQTRTFWLIPIVNWAISRGIYGAFFSSVNHIVKLTNDKCTAVIYCRVCVLCFYVCICLFVCLLGWLMYVYMCSTCVMGCVLWTTIRTMSSLLSSTDGGDVRGIKRRMEESKVAQTREYHVNARNQSYEA